MCEFLEVKYKPLHRKLKRFFVIYTGLVFKGFFVLLGSAGISVCWVAAPVEKRSQVPWEKRAPQTLKVQTVRLSRLEALDQRAGTLAVELRLRYTGTKPLWCVDEPLPTASYEESWTRLKLKPSPDSYDTLVVGQHFKLQNERGELLQTHYPYYGNAAVYVRRPSTQKDGDIRMFFPLNVEWIPLNGPLERWDDRLKPFKHVTFCTQVGIQGDGLCAVRFPISLSVLQNEIKRLQRAR